MFSHTTFEIPHKISYLSQWELQLEPQIYWIPYTKMNMLLIHYYNLGMAPTPTTLKNDWSEPKQIGYVKVSNLMDQQNPNSIYTRTS